MRVSLACVVSLLALLVALPSAFAQEQAASIYGSVRDSSGGVLAGVTVEVKSPSRGVSFMHITDTSGTYRVPTLSAGRYTVTATLFGFNQSTINVDLLLGEALRVDHTMSIGVADAITVTMDAPLIDVKQSASATSIRNEEFERLPVGRDFSSVVTLTPGANRERVAGGISVDGASASENRFVIDGVDTTDPRDGSQAKTLITDFVGEVQVKTAGYAAEFGGATGGVINVVTRGGTNQFRGEVYAHTINGALNGAERPQLAQSPRYEKDDFSQLEPGLSLGGPIVPDRLFFFAAYQPRIISQSRTVRYAGFNEGLERTFETDTSTKYGSANLNGSVGSRVTYKAAANFSPSDRDGLAFPSFPLDIDAGQGGAVNRNGRGEPTVDAAIGREFDNESYSVYVDVFPTPSILLGLRGGRFTTNSRDTGIPNEIMHVFSPNSAPPSVFPDIPAELLRAPGFSNVATNTAVARDRYTRDAVSADATWYLRAGGEHAIKAGFVRERIRNDVFSGELQPRIDYHWGAAHAGTGRRGKYGYFTVRQFATTGDVQEDIGAIYLQDAWTVRDRVTVNFGARAESEDVPQYRSGTTFIDFGYNEKVAPRLGVAYDLFGNGRTKLFASYGTFFDVTKLEWPRGSSGGEVWVDYFFTLDDYDWTKNICSVGNNTTADRPDCPAGTFITASDRRFFDPASVAQTLDPDIKPMETREVTIGAEHAVTATSSVGLRYVRKQLVRTIEDMGVLVGDDEIYIYGNPGSGLSHGLGAVPMPKARRDYDAVELEVSRRFGGGLALRGSLTWSRLWGNYSGLANSDEVLGRAAGRRSPNVNRSFDGLAQAFDQNLEPTYGHLPTDRPYQLKVQATYAAPFGTAVGLNQYAGSGTPQTTEVNLYPTLPFFPYGRGDMGRTPWLTQTDLILQHEIKVGSHYGLQLMVSVLNVFDEDTELYRWNRLLLGDLPEKTGLTQFTFFDAPFDFNEVLTREGGVQGMRDPRYGKPFIYQDPRLVRVGMRLRF
jgi:hypothetical protein